MIATSTAEPIAAALRRAAASGVTSVLRVEVPGDVGYVFLHEGQVVHASTVDLEGEAAATSICGWESGLLTWCERRWPALSKLRGCVVVTQSGTFAAVASAARRS